MRHYAIPVRAIMVLSLVADEYVNQRSAITTFATALLIFGRFYSALSGGRNMRRE